MPDSSPDKRVDLILQHLEELPPPPPAPLAVLAAADGPAMDQADLLAAARARGCATQIGVDMLFEQIPAYLGFFGFPMPTAAELRSVARIEY